MIKKLTEDVDRGFIREDGLIISTSIDDTLLWERGYSHINLHDEWEEVKKPVDFITAIKSGKKIRVKCAIDTYEGKGKWKLREIHYRKPSEMLRTLSSYSDNIAVDIIENGDWYIES